MTKTIRAAILLSMLIPPTVLAYLIHQYGVNVPFWDQWDVASIFPRYHDGTLAFGDLFAQHNESRKVFPRLIFLALGNLSGWNVRWEMAASFVTACVTMASFVWLTLKTHKRVSTTSALALLAVGVMVFSPVQYENWLWGIQLVVFMPIACVALGIVAACTSWNLPIRFALCALLATISTYSYANGMLAWPLLLPALLLVNPEPRKDRRIVAMAWTLLAALEITAYFIGYHKPVDSQPFTLSTQSPLYALAFWGSPLARWSRTALPVAEIFGAALLMISALLIAYVCVRRQDVAVRRQALPWLSVMAYALASGIIAAVGRSASGAQQALDGRYMTFSIYLSVAVVMLVSVVLDDLGQRWSRVRSAVGPSVVFVSLLLIATQAFALNDTLLEMGFSRVLRLQDKAAVQWIGFTRDDPGLSRSYPRIGRLHEQAVAIDRLGFLNPPLVNPDTLPTVLVDVARRADYGGLFAPARLEDGRMLLRGWAVLPHRPEPADAVVVTAEFAAESGGATRPVVPRFVAMSTLKAESADLAEVAGIPAYVAAGFRIAVPQNLPPGTALRAWAWDATAGRGYAIDGSFVLR